MRKCVVQQQEGRVNNQILGVYSLNASKSTVICNNNNFTVRFFLIDINCISKRVILIYRRGGTLHNWSDHQLLVNKHLKGHSVSLSTNRLFSDGLVERQTDEQFIWTLLRNSSFMASGVMCLTILVCMMKLSNSLSVHW